MKVLLAKKFDAAKHNVDGWLASEKLDGMRAFWDGSELLSRNGKRIAAPDWFTASLPSKAKVQSLSGSSEEIDIQLDGELFIGRGQFQRTVSVCRKQVPVDSEWRQVKFMAFDLLTGDHTFRQRYAILSRMRRLGQLPPHVQVVEHRETMTADVPALLRQYEAVGAEGVMLRDPASQYEPKRSNTLLKVKSFLDADATVIGHQPGTGKHRGRLGALLCKLADQTEFGIGTGFTDRQRENPPAVGERVTFSFFEFTDAGVPRFPAFIGVRGD